MSVHNFLITVISSKASNDKIKF